MNPNESNQQQQPTPEQKGQAALANVLAAQRNEALNNLAQVAAHNAMLAEDNAMLAKENAALKAAAQQPAST